MNKSTGKKPILYRIRNLKTERFYVGSTGDPWKRFWNHRNKLRRGKHPNHRIQGEWTKYGEVYFVFEVLGTFETIEEANDAEDQLLVQWWDHDLCYNLGTTAKSPMYGIPTEAHPNYGKPLSPETRAKISESLKRLFREHPELHPRIGKTHTEETKQKISRANKGREYPDHHWKNGGMPQEVRDRIGATQRGVPKGPGRKISEEGMAKIRAAAEAGRYSHWKGRRHTEESRLKMSRPVRVIRADGSEEVFQSITALRLATGLTAATVHRALRSGTPIARGKFEGWGFSYVER